MIPSPTLIRSKKRKRTVALHVQPDGSLRILAPQKTSLSWINAFIAEKAAWIARRRAALAHKKERPLLVLEDGALIPFRGQTLRLALTAGPSPQTSYTEKEEFLQITLPADLSPDQRQEEIRTELILWYKKQARTLLPERVAYWSAALGLHPSRLIWANPRHQWGSCNSKNEIRLNWRLVAAPPAIADYVIAHELCHIPHKNHGVRFWRLMEKIMPDVRQRRQALRRWEKDHHPASFP